MFSKNYRLAMYSSILVIGVGCKKINIPNETNLKPEFVTIIVDDKVSNTIKITK